VAGVAAFSEPRGGELAAVLVAMALSAALVGELVANSRRVRPVTLSAFHRQVLAFQRIGGTLVLRNAE